MPVRLVAGRTAATLRALRSPLAAVTGATLLLLLSVAICLVWVAAPHIGRVGSHTSVPHRGCIVGSLLDLLATCACRCSQLGTNMPWTPCHHAASDVCRCNT
eukprot:12813751-Alexandrium_andersonii.AAC.1